MHIQFVSAGTGVMYSETDKRESERAHFLQIWVWPWAKGWRPKVPHEPLFQAKKIGNRFVTVVV